MKEKKSDINILPLKATRSNKDLFPYGGVIPILENIKKFGIPQVIRKCLGRRNYRAVYGYEDIFIAWVITSLCGGRRLDHITDLQKELSIIPGLKLPSNDTLGRVMKSLATETITKRRISKNGKAKISYTRYNDNIELNRMLIKASIRMGLLKKGLTYKLDIDATFVPTKCYDAVKSTHHKKFGYSPMVCLIGNLPVFISMRSGNASASFDIANCLEQCIELLEESEIKIGKVISDGAGQNKELLEFLDRKHIKYNVRMPFKKNNGQLTNGLLNAEWKETEIRTTNSVWECEIADFPYKMHKSDMDCRIISLKVPDNKTRKLLASQDEKERMEFVEDKLDILDVNNGLKKSVRHMSHSGWINYKGYDYKLIITNDFKTSPKELFLEYNKRGGAERNFEYMKNEFAWELPPFSNMSENTIFLIAASLTNNIYRAMTLLFKPIVPQLRLNARLDKFRIGFINAGCEFINGIFDYGNSPIPYEKLM